MNFILWVYIQITVAIIVIGFRAVSIIWFAITDTARLVIQSVMFVLSLADAALSGNEKMVLARF